MIEMFIFYFLFYLTGILAAIIFLYIIFFDMLNFKQDCNIAAIIVELLFFIRLIFKN